MNQQRAGSFKTSPTEPTAELKPSELKPFGFKPLSAPKVPINEWRLEPWAITPRKRTNRWWVLTRSRFSLFHKKRNNNLSFAPESLVAGKGFLPRKSVLSTNLASVYLVTSGPFQDNYKVNQIQILTPGKVPRQG